MRLQQCGFLLLPGGQGDRHLRLQRGTLPLEFFGRFDLRCFEQALLKLQQGIAFATNLRSFFLEPFFQFFIDAGLKQLTENFLPLGRFSQEQLAEFPLRQNHDLAELIHGQPGQNFYFPGRFADLTRHQQLVAPVGKNLAEACFRFLLGETIPARLRPQLFGNAANMQAALIKHKFKGHFTQDIGRGQIAAHLCSFPFVTGGLPVESKTDRIKNRRFAGPGGPVDQHQRIGPEGGEIDLLQPWEWPKGRHL